MLKAMKQGMWKEVTGDVLAFFGNYTVRHFNDEEKLMAHSNYPDRCRSKMPTRPLQP